MVVLHAQRRRQLHSVERAEETPHVGSQVRRGEREGIQRPPNRKISDELGIDYPEKNMTTLLHTEVANRFAALPEVERIDKVLALVRITAEVTRDLMQDCPEAVDDFLRHFVPQRAN